MDVCKYKPHLKDFDYPNINAFNDEQIQDIFSSENRFFLLTWLIKNLNSQFILPLEWSDSAANIFANFFYEAGFCSSSKNLAFVKGSKGISKKEQMEIFDRIFRFLQATSSKENIRPTQNVNDAVALELLNKDINLFSTLGPVKLRTQEQRQKKIAIFKEKIENLKQAIKSFPSADNEHAFTFENLGCNEEDLDKNVEKFTLQAIKLQEVASVIGKVNKTDNAMERPGFKPDFENYLITCNSELFTVLQYFNNVNLTQSIDMKGMKAQKGQEQEELCRIMKTHVQNSSDIAKIMNMNSSVLSKKKLLT